MEETVSERWSVKVGRRAKILLLTGHCSTSRSLCIWQMAHTS